VILVDGLKQSGCATEAQGCFVFEGLAVQSRLRHDTAIRIQATSHQAIFGFANQIAVCAFDSGATTASASSTAKPTDFG